MRDRLLRHLTVPNNQPSTTGFRDPCPFEARNQYFSLEKYGYTMNTNLRIEPKSEIIFLREKEIPSFNFYNMYVTVLVSQGVKKTA